jgi:3-hydroxyisobutyrate dehydrogenase-like beta-hydroxyacid dehydrogenase
VSSELNVGIIGVGLLGTALAERLGRSGFKLCGFDPDAPARARLEKLGGFSLSDHAQVAQSCRRILLSLPGPLQVRETVDALENLLHPGSIVIDTTTGHPADVEMHEARLKRRGIAYLDCEIGGSSTQVGAGEVIVICGGDSKAFEDCRDILDAISPTIFHTGPAGTGTRMKLALNIAIGLHRAVLAESLAFAETLGIESGLALNILKAGPAYSRAMDAKGEKMLSQDFTPEARLAQHLKDVRLILEAGRAGGAHTPLSALHEKLLAEAVDRGLGTLDNSAIIEVFRNHESLG